MGSQLYRLQSRTWNWQEPSVVKLAKKEEKKEEKKNEDPDFPGSSFD